MVDVIKRNAFVSIVTGALCLYEKKRGEWVQLIAIQNAGMFKERKSCWT
jgi:hypothetical protein